jgi:hypothetical protein
MKAVEDWIQNNGDGAVMTVFGIGMVPRMVFGSLENVEVLQAGDERAIFLARAVGPFVEFVGVGREAGKQPHLPAQAVEPPGDEQ